MTVEIAVQDVEGARIAHEEGADRVELCAALMGTGGLTPSFGMIQAWLPCRRTPRRPGADPSERRFVRVHR